MYNYYKMDSGLRRNDKPHKPFFSRMAINILLRFLQGHTRHAAPVFINEPADFPGSGFSVFRVRFLSQRLAEGEGEGVE